MENEEVKQPEEGLAEEQALLKAYKNLEANSVSREKYEKDIKELKDKADLYLKAITEGQSIDSTSDQDSGSVYDTISELSKFKGTNLDYWKKVTKATDQTLKKLGNEAISKVIGTDGLEQLIKVNEGMKKLVSDSKDDPDYFRTLYKTNIQDSAPMISSQIERAGGLVAYLEKQQK